MVKMKARWVVGGIVIFVAITAYLTLFVFVAHYDEPRELPCQAREGGICIESKECGEGFTQYFGGSCESGICCIFIEEI